MTIFHCTGLGDNHGGVARENCLNIPISKGKYHWVKNDEKVLHENIILQHVQLDGYGESYDQNSTEGKKVKWKCTLDVNHETTSEVATDYIADIKKAHHK